MVDVRYADTIGRLLEVLPEIEPYYNKRRVELYADGLPHVIYGSIFTEFISDLVHRLEHTYSDQLLATLQRAFGLLEELTTSTDFETRALAETSVIESLLGEPGGLRRFAPFFGPQTKEVARSVAASLGLDTEAF